MGTVKSVNSKAYFNTADGEQLSIEEVAQEIIAFMKEDATRPYRITIGTDSALFADKSADFVTAVVVHRVGNGGRYFWRRDKLGRFYTLRDRIMQEVIMSLELGQTFLEDLRCQPELRENGAWEFEIHADIGATGKTKEMIKEVVGMIRAYNFTPQMKPASYAASSVADKHV